MPNKQGFEPSTPLEGFFKAKLEDIEKKIDGLSCKESFARMNKLENEMSNIKGKAAILGALFGIAAIWVKDTFFKEGQ